MRPFQQPAVGIISALLSLFSGTGRKECFEREHSELSSHEKGREGIKEEGTERGEIQVDGSSFFTLSLTYHANGKE